MDNPPPPSATRGPLATVDAVLPRRVSAPAGPLEIIPEPMELAHARPADGGIFRLGARRAALHLSGTRGLTALTGDGVPLLEELAAGAGANLLAGPRSYRRETVVDGAPLMEAGVLPELLPGAVLQWWPTTGRHPADLGLTAVLPLDAPPDGPVRVHRDGGLLWVSRGEEGVLLQAIPASEGVEVPAAELTPHPRGARLSWSLPLGTDGPVSLLVQAAPPGRTWTHLRPLAGVTAHHRRGEDAAVGKDEAGVVVTTGVEAVDRGTAWARTYLRHSLLKVPGGEPRLHGPLPDPLAHARLARAAAAAGEWEVGRAALAMLPYHTPRQSLAAAVAAAGWLLWTGEKEPLAEEEERIAGLFRDRERLAGLARGEMEPARRMIRSAAEAAERPELVELLERPLHGPSPRSGTAPRPGGGGLTLPMAGGGGGPAPAEPAGAGAGGAGGEPGDPALSPGPDPHPDPLFAFGRGDVAPGHRLAEAARWREVVGSILDDPSALDAAGASGALLGLVEGLLGVRSDAAFGRVSVCPLLPPNWTRFRIEGLRSGEGTVELTWERDGDEMRWEVAPRIGSVPVNLIFEPWFPCPAVTDVRMDGQPADLEADSRDGWCRVQVQLPADGHRTLTARAVSPP